MSYRPYSVSHCPYELLILLCALSLLHHDRLYVALFLCHSSRKHERLPMISANALLKVANFPLKSVGVFLWGFTCLWQCWSWLILQSTHKSFSNTGLSLHSHLWYTHGVFLAHMCCSLPLMDIMPACYSWLVVSSILRSTDTYLRSCLLLCKIQKKRLPYLILDFTCKMKLITWRWFIGSFYFNNFSYSIKDKVLPVYANCQLSASTVLLTNIFWEYHGRKCTI